MVRFIEVPMWCLGQEDLGTSYSQMEIIEGRKLVAHKSVFVKFPI